MGMRRADSVADALGRTARYGKTPARERQAISRASTRIDVPAGTVLATQGAHDLDFAIVLTGGATVHANGRVVSALLAGDHFGDTALLTNTSSPATVIAETEMALAVVGPAEFDGLLDMSPTLTRNVLGEDAAAVVMARQPSSRMWKLRGFFVAARSSALRSTQKSLPSGSAIQTQPLPSSAR